MNKSLLSARYALALYEYAVTLEADKSVKEHMELFYANWRNFPGIRMAMVAPTVDPVQKEKLLLMAGGADGEICLVNFFRLLVSHQREQFAGRIANAYVELWNRKNHIVAAGLQSATPLSEATESMIRKLLEKVLPGEKVELKTMLYPDLIGGFVIQLDSLRVDASVKNELRYMKTNLQK